MIDNRQMTELRVNLKTTTKCEFMKFVRAVKILFHIDKLRSAYLYNTYRIFENKYEYL